MRSTDAAALDALPDLRPPPGADAFEAVVSFVAADAGRGPRRLPTVYLGPAPVHADRDTDAARMRVWWLIDEILAARHEAVYSMTACRAGERVGLYLGELFNRSARRMRLRRRGFDFADPPWVRVTGGATLRSAWGEVAPDFVIMPADLEGRSRSAGEILFSMLTHRLWTPAPREVAALRSVVDRVDAVSGDDSAAVERLLAAGRG